MYTILGNLEDLKYFIPYLIYKGSYLSTLDTQRYTTVSDVILVQLIAKTVLPHCGSFILVDTLVVVIIDLSLSVD